MFNIIYGEKFNKSFQKIRGRYKKQILKAIEELKTKPNPDGFRKKLLKGHQNLFRFKVGEYRIIYSIVADKIEIQDVGHRKDIYRFL